MNECSHCHGWEIRVFSFADFLILRHNFTVYIKKYKLYSKLYNLHQNCQGWLGRMDANLVVVAGATGNLGLRITIALTRQNVRVKALVRNSTSGEKLQALKSAGAEIATTDLKNIDQVAAHLEGASCVVSALLGLKEIIVETQTDLLNAALKAGVPRFIPSDYSIDFTKLSFGDNRNLDLHREFQIRIDEASVATTSILNGAFMDLLEGQAPMIRPKLHKVIYWQSADQLLDFTTMDDTAEFTAAAAIDAETPRYLRIAGAVTSARDMSQTLTKVTGHDFGLIRAGSIKNLETMSKVIRAFTPPSDDPFPAWQGMQYFANMFEGRAKLNPLDNDRYPQIKWTTLESFFKNSNRFV